MRLKWLLVLLIAFGAYQHWHARPVSTHTTPGIEIAEDPVQADVDAVPDLHKGEYRIQPLARFDIKARVLGAEHYHMDREADLAPVDLAMGWGAMSDPEILSRISIRQSGRFYYWHVDEFPIPREEIETHSANMHMIPADDHIADQLSSIRPGEIVKLHGYLVEAAADDGWHWRSSLTRNDTGGGACELIWVESVEVL
jgi:hypothetical protein